MLFLNPLLLWGLLAASVPIIIHLINRRRHKTIQWAAMQFLLKATRESRGKKKLRHILILTCRALGIAALAFAAARPIASGFLGWGGGTIDTVVLLLDRSASMEARPGDGLEARRKIVLGQITSAMKNLGGARLVLIDSASAKAQEVPSPDVLAELASTSSTDSAADFPTLLSRAGEFLAETPGRSEVWLASDMQASNWLAEDERWAAAKASLGALPQKPAVRVLSLTGANAPNSSLQLMGSRRTGDELLLDLSILRGAESRGASNLPLTTRMDGTRTTEMLTLPGQSLRFQKRIPLSEGNETGHGWLSIPADGNPRDNAVFFAYGPARPVKSVIVSLPGEALDYLSLAAAPPGLTGQSTEIIAPAQVATLNTSDVSTVLWTAPLPKESVALELERFLIAGGQVIFMPPGKTDDQEFLGMKWGPLAVAEKGKFFILDSWNQTDGPLRDGIDGTPLPVDRLRGIQRQIPIGESAPLARWEDGEPFIARRVVERGTALFLGSIPDYTWSNLGDADVLLPLVQRTLAVGAERFDAAYLAPVSSDLTKIFPGETRRRLDDYGTPDPANAEFEAGVYQLGNRMLAVNRPVSEDAPEILSREMLDAALDGTGYTLLDQVGEAGDPSLSRDVWRAFLIAMLFFLISEAFLCLPKSSSTQVIPEKVPA